MFIRLIIVCAVLGFLKCEEDRPAAELAQGLLSGFYDQTRNGRVIESYISIPYAQPPIGDLRFKAPRAAGKWEGVLDASRETPICVQRNPYIRQEGIHGNEDCLYLSVYVPTADRKRLSTPLPVMVWFHGGGLMCGAGTKEFYGPAHLLDRDVILVGVNYRLGPLGFLSTQDEHCPGNNGLKDQQEALRWVQRNIHRFGGDNASVTLFGESAGGASVHLHMLSPTSAGLFHKGISQSGTAHVPWANAPPGEAARQARRVAKILSCPFTPSDKFLDCLRSKSAEEIIAVELYEWDSDQMTAFKPVVEPDLPGAFISRDVRKIPNTPSVPWLTGITTHEGCMKTTWLLTNTTLMSEFSTGFDNLAPLVFYYDNSPDVDGITRKIKQIYLNGKKSGEIDASDKDGLINLYTDAFFVYGLVESLRIHLQYSQHPTYLYQISYRGSNSFSQIFGDPQGDHGVCHADELMYLFPIDFLLNKFSKKDNEMIEVFLDIWTNFAKTGNPNTPPNSNSERKISYWTPATSFDNLVYMDIGHDLKMHTGLAERAKLWDEMPLWHKFSKLDLLSLKKREEL